MDQSREFLQTALRQIMGSTLGALVVFAAIFLVVLLLTTSVYILLKRRGIGEARVSFQIGTSRGVPGEAVSAPAPEQSDFGRPDNWEPPRTAASSPAAGHPAEDRRAQLLRNLDTVERGVSRFYVVLLCFIMVAITGFAVFLYFKLPDDGNRDFLILYGGVVYLIGMLWAAGQLFVTLRRLSPPPRQADLLSGLRDKINVTFQTSSPEVGFVNNEALDRAQRHMDSGGSLDEACSLMDPKYLAMNGVMQTVFKKAVEVALEARRKPQS